MKSVDLVDVTDANATARPLSVVTIALPVLMVPFAWISEGVLRSRTQPVGRAKRARKRTRTVAGTLHIDDRPRGRRSPRVEKRT